MPQTPNQALQPTAGPDSFLGLHSSLDPAAAELGRSADVAVVALLMAQVVESDEGSCQICEGDILSFGRIGY